MAQTNEGFSQEAHPTHMATDATQQTADLSGATELLGQDETTVMQDATALAPLPVMGSPAAPAQGGTSPEEDAEVAQALKALEERRSQRRRSKLIKAGIAAGVVAALVGGFFAFNALTATPEQASGIETAVVERADFTVSVQGSGSLQPYAQVVVTPEVDGIIDKVNVSEGQQVTAGEVLFTLRSSDIDKAIADAQDALAKAQQEVDRAYAAVGKAQSEKAEACAKHDSAQAAADAARAEAQAAYDAAYNPLKADADAKLAAAQANYDADKARIDPDGKKAAYDQATQASADAQRAVDEAAAARDNAKKMWDEAPADKKVEYEIKYNEAVRVYSEAFAALEAANAAFVNAEAANTQAVNDMIPVNNRLADANTAYQNALAAAASAGENAKAPIVVPDVPPYDASMYDSAIESAQSAATAAESARDTARRTLDQANEQGEKRTVKAPKAGTLIALDAQVGASVGGAAGGLTTTSRSSGSLATIADVSQMRVSLQINEVDITSVKVGQRATVTFSGVRGLEQEAKVVDVATTSTGSGEGGGGGVATFTVDCVIPKPDSRLKPGMTATVTIYTTDLHDVLVLSTSALHELSDGTSVDKVVDPDALDGATAEEPPATERVQVKVGQKNSSEAVIESGLAEGDVVLVGGAGKSLDEMTPEELEALSPEELEALGLQEG